MLSHTGGGEQNRKEKYLQRAGVNLRSTGHVCLRSRDTGDIAKHATRKSTHINMLANRRIAKASALSAETKGSYKQLVSASLAPMRDRVRSVSK